MKNCPNCGSSIDNNALYCPVCSAILEENQTTEFAKRYQPSTNKTPKKYNSSLIFIVLLLFIAGVAGYKYFFLTDSALIGSTEEQVNDYDYYDNNENTLTGKEITLDDFTFTIPEPITSSMKKDGILLENKIFGYYAFIETEDGSVYNAEHNKDKFIQTIEDDNGTVNVFENKTINNKLFLSIEGTKNNRGYYILVTQATKDYVFIVTISTINTDDNNNIINDIASIITSAKKN